MVNKRRGYIQVLGRADALLDALAKSKRPMSLTELFREVKLNKSTTLNILATLVDLGLVFVLEDTRRYRLGPRLLELGNAFETSVEIADLAKPALKALRDATGETASLHIRTGWDRTPVAQEASLSSMRRILELGRRKPLYTGSVGFVLLSGLPDEEIKRYLDDMDTVQEGPDSRINAERVLSAIQAVRVSGAAMGVGEDIPGVSGAAVPVRDHTGRVRAALVFSGPVARLDKAAVQASIPVLQKQAAAISQHLGWAGHAGVSLA